MVYSNRERIGIRCFSIVIIILFFGIIIFAAIVSGWLMLLFFPCLYFLKRFIEVMEKWGY